jgi:hypothetical protein
MRTVRGGPQKFLQVRFQFLAVFFFEVGEFKRLEITLGGPHRKQDDSFAPYAAITDVKQHFYLDSFIQRFLEMKKAAGKRELVQACVNLPAIVQPQQSQNGPGELNPWRTTGFVSSYRSRHDFPPQYDICGLETADYERARPPYNAELDSLYIRFLKLGPKSQDFPE